VADVTADSGDTGRASQILDVATFAFLVAGVSVLPLCFWPWSANVFVDPKFEVMRFLTAGGALTAGGWLLLRRPRLKLSLTDVAVLLFVLLSTVAFAFSIDRQTSLFGEPLQRAGLVTVFSLAGAYGIARLTVRDTARLRIVVSAASAAGTVVALYGVLQLAGADPVWGVIPGDRVFSSVGQPNWLAAYLVMTVPLTAASTLTAANRAGRLLALIGVTVQIFVLIATRSRSGYLGVLLVLAMGALLAIRHVRVNRGLSLRVLAFAAAVLAIGGILLVGLGRSNPDIRPSAIARRVMSAAEIDGFDAQRYVSLWRVGASMTLDHPLIGSGPDTYATLFSDYRDRVLEPTYAEHFSRFRPESPHNVYLSISAGTGIPATVAYIAAIATALSAMVPRIGTSTPTSILFAGIVAAVAGHLVTDWFMTLDLSGSWLFWALIGGGLGLVHAGPRDSAFPSILLPAR
jgi:O-antigen ligase